MQLIDINIERQKEIFQNVNQQTGLSPVSIEKDWWVVQVLSALFSLPYRKHISFKGGTSLSKCWHLIERFSEDVDIAINPEFLGFSEPLTKTQISDKLRRAACAFTREHLQHDLRERLITQGINEAKFKINVVLTPVSTTDPETIIIEYDSVFSERAYVANRVMMEVSGRSMTEPVQQCEVSSLVDDVYPNTPFAKQPVTVYAVTPERTFLEKVFLLHEELAKSDGEIRVSRMSRHLYDIVTMQQKGVAEHAIHDETLYKQVIEHRRRYIGLKGFDYNLLYPKTLTIIPQGDVLSRWREDYKLMQEMMIYGNAPTFDELIQSLISLNEKISSLPYNPE